MAGFNVRNHRPGSVTSDVPDMDVARPDTTKTPIAGRVVFASVALPGEPTQVLGRRYQARRAKDARANRQDVHHVHGQKIGG